MEIGAACESIEDFMRRRPAWDRKNHPVKGNNRGYNGTEGGCPAVGVGSALDGYGERGKGYQPLSARGRKSLLHNHKQYQ